MFGFDWSKGGPWDTSGVQGPMRWVQDMWEIGTSTPPETGDPETEQLIERRVHQTIEKITKRLENFEFNTVVSALMELRNELKSAVREGKLGKQAFSDTMHIVLRLMAPVTPHISEELWERLGFSYSVHTQQWPEYDAEKAAESVVPLVIMVNGRVRDRIEIAAGLAEEAAKETALASESVRKFFNGAEPKRVIFIGGKEPKVNIVV
jgi:leucyl-tRNA synthetase